MLSCGEDIDRVGACGYALSTVRVRRFLQGGVQWVVCPKYLVRWATANRWQVTPGATLVSPPSFAGCNKTLQIVHTLTPRHQTELQQSLEPPQPDSHTEPEWLECGAVHAVKFSSDS